jgi:hypothetical protein
LIYRTVTEILNSLEAKTGTELINGRPKGINTGNEKKK